MCLYSSKTEKVAYTRVFATFIYVRFWCLRREIFLDVRENVSCQDLSLENKGVKVI